MPYVPVGQCALTDIVRQKCRRFVEERARHVLVNLWKAGDVDVRQTFLRPVIGQTGIGMDSISHELLAEAQHLQRMAFHALERGRRPIDQHALGRLADAQCGRIAQPLTGKCLDPERKLGILADVDVERRHSTAHDADAAPRPARPGLEFDFGRGPRRMPVPFRIIAPFAPRMAARFLGSGLDRQDGITICKQAFAVARHEVFCFHQKGTPSFMASSRFLSVDASSRRQSQ